MAREWERQTLLNTIKIFLSGSIKTQRKHNFCSMEYLLDQSITRSTLQTRLTHTRAKRVFFCDFQYHLINGAFCVLQNQHVLLLLPMVGKTCAYNLHSHSKQPPPHALLIKIPSRVPETGGDCQKHDAHVLTYYNVCVCWCCGGQLCHTPEKPICFEKISGCAAHTPPPNFSVVDTYQISKTGRRP